MRPITVVVVLGIVIALATAGLVLYGALSSSRQACEVCVTFRGRTACREALGPTEQEATRTAVDNACAFLAAGMTEIIECTTRTPLDSKVCREN